MSHPNSQGSTSDHPARVIAWQATLTLRERARLIGAGHSIVSTTDHGLAQGAAADWCTTLGMEARELTRRLAADGIAPKQFEALVGMKVHETSGQNTPPSWVAEIEEAFSLTSLAGLKVPRTAVTDPASPFSDLAIPLIDRACERIRAEAKKLFGVTPWSIPINPVKADTLFLPLILRTVGEIVNSTLVHELWESKGRQELLGKTSAERFCQFVERRCSGIAAMDRFADYPVMARLVTQAVTRWASTMGEFLARLSSDWPEISERIFKHKAPGQISKLECSADSHQNGRAVLILTFTSGSRLVYKPRSMAIVLHFQKLLEWCNAHGDAMHFRTITILDKGLYGWSEFVNHTPCSSQDEVARFFERQGGHLALLYVLQATDIHQENVIASGEHPVVVDLESLFHPKIELAGPTQSGYVARGTMADSVMRVGLLPQHFGANGDRVGVQLGGLAKRGGQGTAKAVPVWVDIGTTEMRLERRQIVLSDSHNVPILPGSDVDPLNHEQQVIKGFKRIYTMLMQKKDELLSSEGPLLSFSEDSNRILLRHTDFYAATLRESYNWRLMRDALARDRVFDHLWRVTRSRAEMAKVFCSECEDLWNGDIPMFSSRVNSRDLWNSSGANFAEFFPRSGLECVKKKLSELSEADLERQVWFIRASFASTSLDGKHRQVPVTKTAVNTEDPDRGQFVEAACEIGDWLEDRACSQDSFGIDWLGLLPTKNGSWTIAPIGFDLYNGSAGVTLFLAYLGAISGRKRYTELARSASRSLRTLSFEQIGSVGAFDGMGGVVYSLTHLAALWNDSEVLLELEKNIPLLTQAIEKTAALDIVGGLAGCIGGLASFRTQTNSTDCLKTMVLCGELLCDRWHPQICPLSGFSHGAAGIAWSLVQLFRITGEKKYLGKAIQVVQYERTLFWPDADNWSDLRGAGSSELANASKPPQFMTAWCHGAPGIGLSRLAMLPHFKDENLLLEIRSALRSTLSHGFGSSDCLCHGDLGCLELLLKTEHVLEDPACYHNRRIYSAELWRRARMRNWFCGVPHGVETPGLMVGLAGIGYGLLRLAFPESIPSVLCLEPPTRGNGVSPL